MAFTITRDTLSLQNKPTHSIPYDFDLCVGNPNSCLHFKLHGGWFPALIRCPVFLLVVTQHTECVSVSSHDASVTREVTRLSFLKYLFMLWHEILNMRKYHRIINYTHSPDRIELTLANLLSLPLNRQDLK